MARRATNNAVGQLTTGITSIQTSITLGAGQGATFATLGVGDIQTATLFDAATKLVKEIIRITARNGDTLTILRAQEGTIAQPFIAGDFLSEFATADYVNSAAFIDQKNIFTQPQVIPAATASGEAANLGQVESSFASAQASAALLYLPLAGNSAQAVSVAPATLANHAVNFDQIRTRQSPLVTPLPGAGAFMSFAHGLGVAPKRYDIEVVCLVAEHGCSVGDILRPHTSSTNYVAPYSVGVNSSFIFAKNNAVYGFEICSPATGIAVLLTPSYWAYRFTFSKE